VGKWEMRSRKRTHRLKAGPRLHDGGRVRCVQVPGACYLTSIATWSSRGGLLLLSRSLTSQAATKTSRAGCQNFCPAIGPWFATSHSFATVEALERLFTNEGRDVGPKQLAPISNPCYAIYMPIRCGNAVRSPLTTSPTISIHPPTQHPSPLSSNPPKLFSKHARALTELPHSHSRCLRVCG
jgi:hypothetical protein